MLLLLTLFKNSYSYKGRKGKEKEKIESKRVKYMQNRVELRQKGMITAEKQCIAKRGIYHFWTKT
jgi:hypothetical protein